MTFYPLIKRERSHKIPMGNEKAAKLRPLKFVLRLRQYYPLEPLVRRPAKMISSTMMSSST